MRWEVVWVCATVLACAGHDAPSEGSLEMVSDGQLRMGTVLELTLVASDPGFARAELARSFARVAELERLLSRHRADSELRRLVSRAGQGETPADARTVAVLRRAGEVSRLTGGAFDVTVGPLVALWTRAAVADRIPTDAEVARARAQVGSERIVLPSRRSVSLAAGTELDLGGIAKGWTLDREVEQLRRRGVRAALLSFGQSSVWALGAPPDAPAWRLEARGPDGETLGRLSLRDRALGVSSTFGRYSVIAGRRFGHVVDPRTGWPESRQRHVLVVARDATSADALGTALVLLPLAEGLALVESLAEVESLVLDAEVGLRRSSGWDAATDYSASSIAWESRERSSASITYGGMR